MSRLFSIAIAIICSETIESDEILAGQTLNFVFDKASLRTITWVLAKVDVGFTIVDYE